MHHLMRMDYNEETIFELALLVSTSSVPDNFCLAEETCRGLGYLVPDMSLQLSKNLFSRVLARNEGDDDVKWIHSATMYSLI